MSKKLVTFSIDENIYTKWKNYCNKHGYNYSGKVEVLISKELKKHS